MFTWSYMNELAQEQADSLPPEGMRAFLEFMTAIELAPWNFADPAGGNMPTIPFWGGRGQVTVLILDYRRLLVVTKVQWM